MMFMAVDLPGTGRAHDGHEFSLVDGQIDAVQGVDGLLPHLVDLKTSLARDEVFQYIPPITSAPWR